MQADAAHCGACGVRQPERAQVGSNTASPGSRAHLPTEIAPLSAVVPSNQAAPTAGEGRTELGYSTHELRAHLQKVGHSEARANALLAAVPASDRTRQAATEIAPSSVAVPPVGPHSRAHSQSGAQYPAAEAVRTNARLPSSTETPSGSAGIGHDQTLAAGLQANPHGVAVADAHAVTAKPGTPLPPLAPPPGHPLYVDPPPALANQPQPLAAQAGATVSTAARAHAQQATMIADVASIAPTMAPQNASASAPSATAPSAGTAANPVVGGQLFGESLGAPIVPDSAFAPPPERSVGTDRGEPTGAAPLAAQDFRAPAPIKQARQPVGFAPNIDEIGPTLRVVCLVFGLLALIDFTTPINARPLVFPWEALTTLSRLPIAAQLAAVVQPAFGFIALLAAFAPMRTRTRGALALVAALILAGPLGYALTQAGFPWRIAVAFVANIMVVGGLVWRVHNPSLRGPRMLATVGAAALLAVALVPNGGVVPLVAQAKAVFRGEASTLIVGLVQLSTVVLLVCAILAAWLRPTRLALTVAWLLILWPMVEHYTKLIVAGDIAQAVKFSPRLALTAWMPAAALAAAAGYGLAALLWQARERS